MPQKGFSQLTSKIGPIGYYKGKGGAPMGRHTSKGGFWWFCGERAVAVVKGLW